MELDPVSRNRPFRLDLKSTGFFWASSYRPGRPLIVRLVDFKVSVLVLEAVGAREYCCMAVENRLEALCSVRAPRATRDERPPKRVGGVGLSQKPPKLPSWRRATKATADVAVVGKMISTPRAAAIA